MNEDFHRDATDDHDANAMLDTLLLHLETILQNNRNATDGVPHFLVEVKLKHALETELPGVTFTAADISVWAANFSS